MQLRRSDPFFFFYLSLFDLMHPVEPRAEGSALAHILGRDLCHLFLTRYDSIESYLSRVLTRLPISLSCQFFFPLDIDENSCK